MDHRAQPCLDLLIGNRSQRLGRPRRAVVDQVAGPPRIGTVQTFEKNAWPDVKKTRDFIQFAGRNPVVASLVFLQLLKG